MLAIALAIAVMAQLTIIASYALLTCIFFRTLVFLNVRTELTRKTIRLPSVAIYARIATLPALIALDPATLSVKLALLHTTTMRKTPLAFKIVQMKPTRIQLIVLAEIAPLAAIYALIPPKSPVQIALPDFCC